MISNRTWAKTAVFFGALFAIGGCAGVPEASLGGVASNEPIRRDEMTERIERLADDRARRPDDVSLPLEQAELYRRLDRLDDADAAYRDAMGVRPDDPAVQAEALEGLGQVAQVQGRSGDAAMLYSEGFDRANESGDTARVDSARYRLAVLARSLGDMTTACSWYQNISDRALVETYLEELACASDPSVRGFHQAAREVRQVVDGDAAQIIGAAEGYRQSAESAYARGEAQPDHLARAYADYSSALLRHGRYEQAAEAALRAAELRPNAPEMRVYVIVPLVLLDRMEEAELHLGEIIRTWVHDVFLGVQSPHGILHSQLGLVEQFSPNDLDRAHREWLDAAHETLSQRDTDIQLRRARLTMPPPFPSLIRRR